MWHDSFLCFYTTPGCRLFSIICLLLFDPKYSQTRQNIRLWNGEREKKWQARRFQNERHLLYSAISAWTSAGPRVHRFPCLLLWLITHTHTHTHFLFQTNELSPLSYLLVSPISYSLSLSSSKMSTSSLPVVERLLFLLMFSLASVMAKRSPLLHSIGSSRMAAGGKERWKRNGNGTGGWRWKREREGGRSLSTPVIAVCFVARDREHPRGHQRSRTCRGSKTSIRGSSVVLNCFIKVEFTHSKLL